MGSMIHAAGNSMNVSGVALLLIDVVNDFEFEDGAAIFKYALPAARNIQRLKKRAKSVGIPVIYINDNFGNWQDDFQRTVQNCLRESVRGGEIVKLLMPEDDDYFVLKPKHSAFYSTTLEVLLKQLNVETLLLCGFSTDICILFSANDAYMRGYKIFVPSDCSASVDFSNNKRAIKYIERVLKADTRISTEFSFRR